MSSRPAPSHQAMQRARAELLRFFAWWGSELASLLPTRLRAATDGSSERVLLVIEGSVLSLRRRKGERWVEVARRALEGLDPRAQQQAVRAALKDAQAGTDTDGALALALPATQVLRREVSLPLRAEDDLAAVLGFELDRYTPFRADQVYFDHRVIARDPALGRLRVLLGVVSRANLDPTLEQLARWDLHPAAAVVIDDLQPRVPPLNFLPPALRPRRRVTLRLHHKMLIGLVAVLAVVALALPLAIKREASIRLLPVVARADAGAQAVEALRDRLHQGVDTYNLLIAKKNSRPSTVALLDELSSMLPDDTWVQQLTLNGKNLVIQGDTGSSGKLLDLFAHSRLLAGANFTAPLVKNANNNSEHYVLSAQVQAPVVAAASAAMMAQPLPGKAGVPARGAPAIKPMQTRPAASVAPKASPAATPAATRNAASVPRPSAARVPSTPKPPNHPASAPRPAHQGGHGA